MDVVGFFRALCMDGCYPLVHRLTHGHAYRESKSHASHKINDANVRVDMLGPMNYLWPEGRNPRVGTLRGHLAKRGLLGASEWPTFFPRSFENGHTSPRLLKSLSRGLETFPGL